MPIVRWSKQKESTTHNYQVDLSVKSGGKIVSVTMFVQPDSVQKRSLGTNTSLPLGFNFVDGKGKPLKSSSDHQVAESESELKVPMCL